MIVLNCKKYSNLIIRICIFLILICSFFYTYFRFVKPTEQKVIESSINALEQSSIGEIGSETVVSQSFYSTANGLLGITLKFGTYVRNNVGNINIKIVDVQNNSLIYETSIDMLSIIDNQVRRISFDEALLNSKDKYYEIIITSPNATACNAVTLYVSSLDNYKEGKLLINNEIYQGDLVFGLLYEAGDFLIIPFIILCIYVLIFTVIVMCICDKKFDISKIAFILIIGIGLLYIIIFPPKTISDEDAHINTTYKWANKLLGDETNDGTILKRVEDISDKGFELIPSIDGYYKIKTNIGIDEVNNELVKTPGDRVTDTKITMYLFQVFGFLIARILNLNYIFLIYLGRFFNLLVYALGISFAIKRIPVGKIALLVCSLFPMALNQAASLSYDVMPIILSFIMLSECMRIANLDTVKIKDFILPTIIMVMLIPMKSVYCMLMVLIFLISPKKFNTKKECYTAFGMFFLIVLSFCIVDNRDLFYESFEVLSIKNEVVYYEIIDVLKNPIDVFGIVLDTIYDKFDMYIFTMAGSNLAWFAMGIGVPNTIIMIYYFLAIYALKLDCNSMIQINKKVLFISAIGVIGLIFLGALTWNFKGVNIIDGVQGRYFLPIFPILLFLLPLKKEDVIFEQSKYNMIIFVVLLQIFTLLRVFSSIVIR